MNKLLRWYSSLVYFFEERRMRVIYRIDHFWMDGSELFLRYRSVGNRPSVQTSVQSFISENRYLNLSEMDRVRIAKSVVLQKILSDAEEKEGKVPEWMIDSVQAQLVVINQGAGL